MMDSTTNTDQLRFLSDKPNECNFRLGQEFLVVKNNCLTNNIMTLPLNC